MDLIVLAKASIVVVLYLGIYIFTALLFSSKIHKNSIINLCLLGFVVYYSIFQIIALPMKIMCMPLKYLSVAWAVFLAVLFIFVICKRKECFVAAVKGFFSSREKFLYGLLFLILTCIFAMILGMNTNHISDYDAGYYIGLPVSSVYSNTIERMDPYSGALLSKPIDFYMLNTNTNHSAVFYQLLGLHPLVETKYSVTITMAILFCLAIYKCGSLMFDNYKKNMVFVWFTILALIYSYSLAGVSHYFAYRTYEGKAICAYYYTISIFVFFLGIYTGKFKEWGWRGLFFTALSGIAFCNTAIFIIPVMISAFIIPMIVMKRRWKEIKNYFIIMLPCVFWIGMYMVF